MTEPGAYLGIVMRTPATNGQQRCDAACSRWQGLPHAHLHFDGLYDPTPYLTLGAYCSCGALVDPMVTYNVDVEAERLAQVKHPVQQYEAFKAHMVDVHGIDIEANVDWLDAANRAP